MIREFSTEDKEQLIKIVKQGIVIVGQDYVDLINGEANRIIVYYDNESELTGFASLKIWGSDKKNGEVFTYVAPGSRRKGIGSLLYNEIMRYAIDLKLNLIDTGFRVDKDDSTLFYKKLGYEKWYGLHDMHYDGLEQPKSDMKFVSYEDKYFEQYVEGLRTSYIYCSIISGQRVWKNNNTICYKRSYIQREKKYYFGCSRMECKGIKFIS